MKHQILYNQEENIAEIKVIRDISPEEADQIVKVLGKALEGKANRHVLADISQSPLLQMDKKARITIAEGAKTLDLGRIAVIGTTPMNRMMAKVILALFGKSKDTSFFKTKDEALAWLKESNGEASSLV